MGPCREKYGVSVAKLLGGHSQRLPVYASTCPGVKSSDGLNSIEAYADFAEECVERGIPAFKIHGFGDGETKNEIGIMEAIRNRIGHEIKLMTDPASSLRSFMDAVEVGKACDDLNFFGMKILIVMLLRVPLPMGDFEILLKHRC